MPWVELSDATAAAAPISTLGAPKTSVGETLNSLQLELAKLLANRADVDIIRRRVWINRGYRAFASMLDLPELKGSISLAAVAAQRFYKLPLTAGGFCVVAAIKYGGVVDAMTYREGGRPLEALDEVKYRQLPERTGEPTGYLHYKDFIVLWPEPINARTVVFDIIIRPSDLVADTDSPILPIEFHPGIPLSAKEQALRDLRSYAEADLAANDVVRFLSPMTNFGAEEQSQQFGQVTPVTRSRRDIYRRVC